MKKIVLVLCLVIMFSLMSYAKTYVVISKETGDIKGVTDISDDSILEWTKGNIVKEVGDEFRGKQPYEITIKGNSVKLATEQDLKEHSKKTADQKQLKERKKILDILGITQEQLDKLKGE